jgi:hypothetical protein
MAKDFSTQRGAELVVLIPEKSFEQLVSEARDLLGDTPVRYKSIASAEAREILNAMLSEGSSMIFWPRDETPLFEKLPAFLLDALVCPLVVVS